MALRSASRPGGSFGDNLRHTLRALRGRNYSLFFMGQGLSLIGTWMQGTAMAVLIWQMTHRPQDLGMVGFCGTVFGFLLAPFAGVFSDRWPRRRVLLVTQSLSLIQASAVAVLTLTGVIQIWHVMALAAFMSLINAFDIPTRQAFVVQMVDRKEDLPNAIALNSFMFNGARLIGPLVAGFVIPLGDEWLHFPHAGEGVCFAANAVSYVAVLISLMAMRLKPHQRRASHPPVFKSLREGFRYAFDFKPIRAILLMLAAVSFLSMPYSTLMPAVDSKVIHHSYEVPRQAELVGKAGQAANIPPVTVSLAGHSFTFPYERTYSMFLASIGVGAIVGALYLASRRSVLGLGKVIAVATVILGAGMIGFSLSNQLWVSMLLLTCTGFGFMVQMASSNTMLQTLVDEDKRGRVMSFYMMSFQGTAPLGALAAGWGAYALGKIHGEQITIGIAGGVAILAALAFATRLPMLRAQTRPLYLRLGILTEAAPAPGSASAPAPAPAPEAAPGQAGGDGLERGS
jgi:MFS family permease